MTVASEQGSNVADFIFRIAPAGGQQGQSDELTPETLRVTGFAGHEGVNEVFSYRVELCTDDIPIELESMVGAGCCLEIRGQGSRRLVQGVIRQFERTGHGSRFIYYAAEVVPPHWYLSRRQTCRIFQKSTCDDMSVPGIIKKVLLDAGLLEAAFEFRVDTAAYPPREYVVQYRESDLNFITRLCEEEGIFYFFEHRTSGTVMVFADVPDAHKDARQVHLEAAQAQGGDGESTFNEPAIPFRSPSGMVHERYAVFDARARNSAEVGAVALDDFEFQRPEQDLLTATAKAPQERFTALSVYDYPAGRIERAGSGPDQVRLEDNDAVIRLQAQQCQRRVLTMATTARHLVAGCWFTLVDHPDATFNGEYVITHLSARATQTQSTEEEQDAVTGARFEINLTAIPRVVPYRPPRVTPRPTVLGSQTAIVVKQQGNDDEIYVDEFGRVKVQFHWDHEQDAEESSMFVRVAQAWSGAGWGFMFIPRVGQEVIVDFLEGDPDRPIITGRVYNRTHMPPYKLPDEKTKSTIKTNSTEDSKRFHEIRFEDKNKSEQLFIRAQRRMDTRVLGTHYHTAGGSLHEHLGGEDDEGNKKGRYYRTTFEGEDLHNKGDHYQWIEDIQHLRIEKDVLHGFQQNYALFVKDKIEINAKEFIVELKDKIALKVGGNFIVIDQQGVTIVGTKVKINSGGSAPTIADKQQTGPMDAIPADTGKPGARGRGGRPRTRPTWTLEAQHAPPPPPPPHAPIPPPVTPVPPDLKCALLKITAQCEHKDQGVRMVMANMTLEVVPSRTLGRDRIDLAAEVQMLCGPQHPEWSITNESSRAGLTTFFHASPPILTTAVPWIPKAMPKKYQVTARCCNGPSQSLQVHAYPNVELDFTLDLKKTAKWLYTIIKGIEWAVELVAEKFEWKIAEGAGSVTASWKEYTDYRAYYGYKITAAFNPLFGAEGKITFGTSWITGKIKKILWIGKYVQKVIDWLVKAGVYLKPAGGIGCDFSVERNSPDQPLYPTQIAGGVNGKVSLALGVEGNVVGDKVISVQLEAGGAVVAGGQPFVDDVGFGLKEFKVDFDGLKGTVKIKLIDGWIEHSETWTFIGSKNIWGPRRVYFYPPDVQ